MVYVYLTEHQGRIKASVGPGAVPNAGPYTAHKIFPLPPIAAPLTPP